MDLNVIKSCVMQNLEEFSKKLNEEIGGIDQKEIEIPKIYIPNWPFKESIFFCLGRKNFLFPKKEKTGKIFFINKKGKIYFAVFNNGLFYFRVTYSKYNILKDNWDSYESYSNDNFERICALVLFQQFKEEIFFKIMQVVRKEIQKGKESEYDFKKTAEYIEKAFAPFRALGEGAEG